MNKQCVIKPMTTDMEIEGKAYVHWKAWHEAYTGIVPDSYLVRRTLEHCVKSAYNDTSNTYVAIINHDVAGFVSFGKCRDEDVKDQGEIGAIYILQKYYGEKIGYSLMQEALSRMTEYNDVYVWVLEENDRAILFYEKVGFKKEDKHKSLNIDGVELREIRMKKTQIR